MVIRIELPRFCRADVPFGQLLHGGGPQCNFCVMDRRIRRRLPPSEQDDDGLNRLESTCRYQRAGTSTVSNPHGICSCTGLLDLSAPMGVPVGVEFVGRP